jgi:hypothetical protein
MITSSSRVRRVAHSPQAVTAALTRRPDTEATSARSGATRCPMTPGLRLTEPLPTVVVCNDRPRRTGAPQRAAAVV